MGGQQHVQPGVEAVVIRNPPRKYHSTLLWLSLLANITRPLRQKVLMSAPAEDVQTHVDPGHEEEAGQQPHGGGELGGGTS